MKTTFRIPTREQYSYFEVEEDKDMAPKQIAERYIELTNAYHDKIREIEESEPPFKEKRASPSITSR